MSRPHFTTGKDPVPILQDLGALYGPLIPHTLPVSVHRTIVNACKDIMYLKPLHRGQYLLFYFSIVELLDQK